MKTLALIILMATCALAQKFNGVATGRMDASGLTFIFPTATFSSPPSSPPTGATYIFTDGISAGTCSGGGTFTVTCRFNGVSYVPTGGTAGTNVGVDVNGSLVGTRPTINIIAGTNATASGVDNSGANRVDVTISSTGGGGGGVGGGQPYISGLQSGPDTTKTIAGGTHGFTTTGLVVTALDNSTPRNSIQVSWTVDPSTYDVVVAFGTPQSSYYIVIMSGAGGNSLPPFTCPVSSATSVTCNHNLNTTAPGAWCYDSAGLLMGSTGSAANVTIIDSHLVNTSTITFSGTVTGTCIITSGASGGGFSQVNSLAAGGGTAYQTNNDCNKGSVSLSSGTFTYPGGTVAAAGANSQEFTIITALNGNQRYDHALVSEHTQFTSGTVTALKASIGRPTAGLDDELVAQQSLMVSAGDANFAYERPQPPILGSGNTYTLVLALRSTGGNISALTAGQVNYEICGYLAH